MIVQVALARSIQCPQLLSTPGPAKETSCIGQQCMAWRWYDPERRDVVMMGREEVARQAGISVEIADPEVASVPYGEQRRGYCGLAGLARP